jgi:hypothetical protein
MERDLYPPEVRLNLGQKPIKKLIDINIFSLFLSGYE